MSIRNRRNSVRKSSISIDGIRNSVRLFNKGISVARNISNDILEKTRERNRFKQTLNAKDNEYFRRRQENIKRRQREDELEAQDVKKLPKMRGNIITRSTRGLLGRLLDFLGVLLVGFVINNLPRIMKAVSSVIKKIKKVVEILDPFIKGIQFFLEGIATVIRSVFSVFKNFDFAKDKKNIEESVDQANNNLLRLNRDFVTSVNEFVDNETIQKVPEMLKMMEDVDDVESEPISESTLKLADVKTDSDVEGRASGGPVMKNESYIVGEEGPELFIPDQSGDIVTDEQLEELQGMMDNNNEIEGVQNESELEEIAKVKPQKVNDGSGVIPTAPESNESITSVMRGKSDKKNNVTGVNKDVNVNNITPVRRTRSTMVGRRKRKSTIMIIEKPIQQNSNPSMVGGSGQGSRIMIGDNKSDVLSSLQGLQLKKI